VHLWKTVKLDFCPAYHNCYRVPGSAMLHHAAGEWLRPQSLMVKFHDHLWCIKYESKQACKRREEAMIIDNCNYISLARCRYDTLISSKQLTCTCSKFLMMSVPVCEIRLKKLCVHEVSANSRKAGRGFHQSILTYHTKPMCAVKTNMPNILSEKIDTKRLCTWLPS